MMKSLLSLGLLAGLLVSAVPGHALTLAEKGKTRYVIVTAADALPAEKTAAKDLASYLRQVTGAAFPILEEKAVPANRPQILVGPSARVKRLLPGTDWKALGKDGILLKTSGNRLILAGGRPRGTLYAVYTFLEEMVGVRWWTSSESFAPAKPTLKVASLSKLYVPKIRSREAFYRDVNEHPVFAARLKSNGHFAQIPPTYGGHYSILGWCHTFYQLLPPDKYFKDHPEWYSEINGRRTYEGAQLCLSNEEMRRELTRVALEWIAKQPEAGMISIAQNDCWGPCQCEKCKAVEQEEDSPAGNIIRFVNAVASDIAKKHPDFLVETLAYQYTRKPPKLARPSEHVVVRLCSIECDFFQPLDSEANRDFRNDIRGWSAIAPNLYIWDYVTNFSSYILPHPNLNVLADNVRFFEKHHAIGIFEQGDAGCAVGDFVRLRAWLLSHLMWDPSRDARQLAGEFLKGYYGPAAPYLISYLALVHNAFAKGKGRLSCYNGSNAYLTLDVMNEATRLFREAEKAVSGNPVLAARVRRERLPLDHVWLVRYQALQWDAEEEKKPFTGPADPVKAANEYIRLAKRHNAGQYREGAPFESYEASLKSLFRPPAPPPPGLTGKPAGASADIQDNYFTLFNSPDWVSIVDDPNASDGKAARMPGGHTQWAVQYSVTRNALYRKPAPWRVYMSVRCEGKAKTGPAFILGIYDGEGGQVAFQQTVDLEAAGDGLYHIYDLGVHTLKPGMYFWASPPGSAETVEAVYVDRFYIVKEEK
ncbi:MAG: DUF4838 domain-containing protein [Armatimonadetes bacterium]|nr:DUF4838 domain-containing protein [Armatimonadota bacterium]